MGLTLASFIPAIITRLQSTSTDRIVLMFCQYNSRVTPLIGVELPLIHTCNKIRHSLIYFLKYIFMSSSVDL